MRRLSMMLSLGGVCIGLVAGSAQADRVHLVEGSVLDGKVTRRGDQVVIELESGELALPADAVARIEQAPSVVERFEQLEAKHANRGVPGLMELADFCRDHGMRGRELALLQNVIELQSDHAEARARLGYVKGSAGWIKQEDQLRAQGFIKDGGEYITREQQLERERQKAEADTAKHARDKAQLEVEAQRIALERQRLELERDQAAAKDTQDQQAAAPYFVYGGGYGHSHGHHPHSCQHADCRRPSERRVNRFPIAGVRDPRDSSWRIPGVKDPRRER